MYIFGYPLEYNSVLFHIYKDKMHACTYIKHDLITNKNNNKMTYLYIYKQN